jgi:hypothetical protein
MNTEESKLEAQQEQLDIPVVINRLFDLKRYGMKAYGCFGMAGVSEIEDNMGGYVKWEDIRKLITKIRVSNGL